MVDLIPALEPLIGPQPPVSELPPQDAQRRFQLVFRRLLGVFARPEHPLALFLDDLQWLDAATLDLLGDLTIQSDVGSLLLLGAFRDNEVGPTHPLARSLQEIRRAGGRVSEIVLSPLARADVGHLVADALHSTAETASPLADLVYDKTGGNPFFTIQFLTALAEEKLLVFSPGAGRWLWDLKRIRAKGYSENVVELMVGKTRPPGRRRRRRPCNGWPHSATPRNSPCSRSFLSDPPRPSMKRSGRRCGWAWCFGGTRPTLSCTTGFRRRPIR